MGGFVPIFGQDHMGIKWNQTNKQTFSVIFHGILYKFDRIQEPCGFFEVREVREVHISMFGPFHPISSQGVKPTHGDETRKVTA